MSLEVLDGDLTALARVLDGAASEVSAAKLNDQAGAVAQAMPGAGSGAAMQSAVQSFDASLRQFADALTSDADAASTTDADFVANDTAGGSSMQGVQWNDPNAGIYTA